MAARKPETTFISSVHRYLDTVYHEKMNNPYRSGTADVWYSGVHGDIWVEYKWIDHIPKMAAVDPRGSLMTPRQVLWLNNRLQENRRVAVIIGCPEGGLVLQHKEWERLITPIEFRMRMIPRDAIAEWLRSITGESPCLSSDASSLLQRSLARRIVSSRRRS